MTEHFMKRLMIGGTQSGCGKTTVTAAVLAALTARKMKLAPYKCGPDYIDPLFHREVLSLPSRQPSAPSRLSHASAVLASLPSK